MSKGEAMDFMLFSVGCEEGVLLLFFQLYCDVTDWYTVSLVLNEYMLNQTERKK